MHFPGFKSTLTHLETAIHIGILSIPQYLHGSSWEMRPAINSTLR